MTDEQRLKRKFAEAWLRNPTNAYAAALSVTKNDTFLAIRLADAWVWDDEVVAIKEELIAEHGEEHFLPTKCQMVRQVLERAKYASEDGFHKMMKLAADMRGFIEKPGLTINNNTQTNNRVMLIPMGKMTEQGTVDMDSWEQSAIEQQQSLIR